mmetsp:Transcript_40189/g.102893  ORF Transcript_40189/g.102893 Transcript_40189/m.102893 type:complete len:217 (+) Transcript_40189:1834-2484(+)
MRGCDSTAPSSEPAREGCRAYDASPEPGGTGGAGGGAAGRSLPAWSSGDQQAPGSWCAGGAGGAGGGEGAAVPGVPGPAGGLRARVPLRPLHPLQLLPAVRQQPRRRKAALPAQVRSLRTQPDQRVLHRWPHHAGCPRQRWSPNGRQGSGGVDDQAERAPAAPAAPEGHQAGREEPGVQPVPGGTQAAGQSAEVEWVVICGVGDGAEIQEEGSPSV